MLFVISEESEAIAFHPLPFETHTKPDFPPQRSNGLGVDTSREIESGLDQTFGKLTRRPSQAGKTVASPGGQRSSLPSSSRAHP